MNFGLMSAWKVPAEMVQCRASDLLCAVIHLSKLSTADSSASLELQLVFYWTDTRSLGVLYSQLGERCCSSRFVGWDKDDLTLPDNTWGPECRVTPQ